MPPHPLAIIDDLAQNTVTQCLSGHRGGGAMGSSESSTSSAGAGTTGQFAGELPPAFVDALVQALGPDVLSREADDLVAYGKDWTRVHAPRPSAIVFPRSTAEVARVLALCSQHGVPVVP